MTAEVVVCVACNKDIAAMALTCTGCGAPNSWRHLGVARFLEIAPEVQTESSFNCRHDKTKVRGVVGPRLTQWGWIAGGTGLVALLPAGHVLGLAALCVEGALLAIVIYSAFKTDHFNGNFESKTWTSANDKVREPVNKEIDQFRP